MADRFWEHNTPRRHIYVDGDTGRILGTLLQLISTREFRAHAYDRNVGDYAKLDDARRAVEVACTQIEAERTTQADGASE